MIGFIKGRIVFCEEGSILIDNKGIGYIVNVPDPSKFARLTDEASEVTVYTHMIVKEDDISLYGFKSRADLLIFKRLITVNGVGAKAALAILSIMQADELSKAIIFEDIDSITRAPGVGKKTAQRIILELKDKLGDISGLSAEETSFASEKGAQSDGTAATADARVEALQALLALGYSRTEAADALSRITEELDDVQDYIKKALSRML